MSDKKVVKAVGLGGLIALVVGSMVGTGVFDLPRNMTSDGAGGLAILLAWLVTAVGMIALGYSFLNLSNRRPDLEGGVFSYAREGFGEYWGFNNAWAYWISALLGNVAYAVGLLSAIQFFLPDGLIFADAGPTILGIAAVSILLWLVHFLIVNGVQTATLVNVVVTIAKAIPLILFAILAVIFFNWETFSASFLGGLKTISWAVNQGDIPSMLNQVRSTMLATVWSFIGVEGAVLFSSRARNKKDVGKATIIGLLSVIVLYMLITISSLGIMSHSDLGAISTFPATAVIMQEMVGPWGAAVINIGVIISISGAWLAWTLLGTETPYLAAQQGLFPKFFAKLNKNETPINSLLVSNIIVQLFLVLVYMATDAYEFGYTMASSAILFPYAFSAFFQVKYMLKQKAIDSGRALQIVIGVVASIYSLWLFYGAGLDYMAFTCLLFVPALAVFIYHQWQKGVRPIMKVYEWAFAVALSVLGFVGLYWVIIGKLELFS